MAILYKIYYYFVKWNLQIATPNFQTLLEGYQVLKLTAQLPLKDLFINRKLEFDCDLESLKILFSELNIQNNQYNFI